MTPVPKYLYCVIRCPHERTFDGVAAIGAPEAPVYTVAHGDLAAVVSDSPATRYETTRANMLAHERVLERVLMEFALLPVRFGTVADSATALADIQRLLQSRRAQFEGLLRDMQGKSELGLKTLWRDERRVFEEILAQHAPIRRLRLALEGMPLKTVRLECIRLGQMVKDALGRKRSAEAAGILAPLRRIACRTVENPILVDRMVTNAAFLVEHEREGDFDRAAGDLEARLGHRLLLRYVGPVPPYNFVNIVVNWQEVRGESG